ncbi:MAG: tetratricopeptide repeat protein [Sphingobacteriia bacterium]|nr:tetratricopeptide repeat protein [Sphingobacteriia bacterium]
MKEVLERDLLEIYNAYIAIDQLIEIQTISQKDCLTKLRESIHKLTWNLSDELTIRNKYGRIKYLDGVNHIRELYIADWELLEFLGLITNEDVFPNIQNIDFVNIFKKDFITLRNNLLFLLNERKDILPKEISDRITIEANKYEVSGVYKYITINHFVSFVRDIYNLNFIREKINLLKVIEKDSLISTDEVKKSFYKYSASQIIVDIGEAYKYLSEPLKLDKNIGLKLKPLSEKRNETHSNPQIMENYVTKQEYLPVCEDVFLNNLETTINDKIVILKECIQTDNFSPIIPSSGSIKASNTKHLEKMLTLAISTQEYINKLENYLVKVQDSNLDIDSFYDSFTNEEKQEDDVLKRFFGEAKNTRNKIENNYKANNKKNTNKKDLSLLFKYTEQSKKFDFAEYIQIIIEDQKINYLNYLKEIKEQSSFSLVINSKDNFEKLKRILNLPSLSETNFEENFLIIESILEAKIEFITNKLNMSLVNKLSDSKSVTEQSSDHEDQNKQESNFKQLQRVESKLKLLEAFYNSTFEKTLYNYAVGYILITINESLSKIKFNDPSIKELLNELIEESVANLRYIRNKECAHSTFSSKKDAIDNFVVNSLLPLKHDYTALSSIFNYDETKSYDIELLYKFGTAFLRLGKFKQAYLVFKKAKEAYEKQLFDKEALDNPNIIILTMETDVNCNLMIINLHMAKCLFLANEPEQSMEVLLKSNNFLKMLESSLQVEIPEVTSKLAKLNINEYKELQAIKTIFEEYLGKENTEYFETILKYKKKVIQVFLDTNLLYGIIQTKLGMNEEAYKTLNDLYVNFAHYFKEAPEDIKISVELQLFKLTYVLQKEEALKVLTTKMLESIKDFEEVTQFHSYLHFANLYINFKKADQARFFLKKAEDIYNAHKAKFIDRFGIGIKDLEAQLLLVKAGVYRDTNNELFGSTLEELRNIEIKCSNTFYYPEILNTLIICEVKIGNLERAKDYLEKLEKHSENKAIDKSLVLFNYFEIAEKLAESDNHLNEVIEILNKALAYKKAYNLKLSGSRKESYYNMISNLGYNYLRLNNYAKAEEYYKKTLKKQIKNQYNIYITLDNLADTYFRWGVSSKDISTKAKYFGYSLFYINFIKHSFKEKDRLKINLCFEKDFEFINKFISNEADENIKIIIKSSIKEAKEIFDNELLVPNLKNHRTMFEVKAGFKDEKIVEL